MRQASNVRRQRQPAVIAGMKRLLLLTLLLSYMSVFAAVDETTKPASNAAASSEPVPVPAQVPEPADDEVKIIALLQDSSAAADIQQLMVDGKSVLSLWRKESYGRLRGAVILLHDIDVHADWPGVIGLLRRELPEYGWHTLSLQLVDGEQTPARIRAALSFVEEKTDEPIILLGHGAGALAALQLAIENKSIDGVILIGLGDSTATGLLEKVEVPVYDIYGAADSLEVRNSGAQRLSEGRRLVRQEASELPRYRQFVLVGADHSFSQQSIALLSRVRGWLQTYYDEKSSLNVSAGSEQKP